MITDTKPSLTSQSKNEVNIVEKSCVNFINSMEAYHTTARAYWRWAEKFNKRGDKSTAEDYREAARCIKELADRITELENK